MTDLDSALRIVQKAIFKLEQGYYGGFVEPRFEFDELIKSREDIKLLRGGKERNED